MGKERQKGKRYKDIRHATNKTDDSIKYIYVLRFLISDIYAYIDVKNEIIEAHVHNQNLRSKCW